VDSGGEKCEGREICLPLLGWMREALLQKGALHEARGGKEAFSSMSAVADWVGKREEKKKPQIKDLDERLSELNPLYRKRKVLSAEAARKDPVSAPFNEGKGKP